MCTESPILPSWEIPVTSRLVTVAQASHLNSLQGKEDVSIAWWEKTARHLIFLQIQPIYLFNFTRGYLLVQIILSCQELTGCHCQAQDTALYTHTNHLYSWKGKKRRREGTTLTHSVLNIYPETLQQEWQSVSNIAVGWYRHLSAGTGLTPLIWH